MKPVSRRQFVKSAGLVAASAKISSAQGAPRLSLTCADYLRFTPLATGDLKPADIDLTWIRGPRSEMLRRAASDAEVDGGETSMLGHLLRVDQGDRSLVAVPVFPLRNFTARDIYILKGSSLTPRNLEGRRAGIYNWAASGAVWYRHFVRYCEQDPAAMKWLVGGIDQPNRIQHRATLPPYVTDAPADRSLSELLLEGEIDLMFAPLPPKQYHAVDGPIVRLVPDFRAVEKGYFEDTACFPTQHVLVLRRQTWERNPELGPRLVELLQECESKFQNDIHLFPYSTPWMNAEVETTDLVLGRDFHAHGLARNRHDVDVFCQAAFDDGLTKRRVTVDEYFAEFLRG